MKNATSFGKQAAIYAKGRPGYPAALYKWIAGKSPAQTLVWDVGTGSGQAAQALTEYFDSVYATDISTDQISAAKPHSQISYYVAPAQMSGLADSSADCISIATALHWFADAPFWDEVKRVAVKNAFFCAWTYQLPQCEASIHTQYLTPILDLIDPYWAQGNRICMEGYTAENLNCPFAVTEAPKFDAGGIWTAQQLVNFIESWSAHFRALEDGLAETLNALSVKFLADKGDESIDFKLPISLLAAQLP